MRALYKNVVAAFDPLQPSVKIIVNPLLLLFVCFYLFVVILWFIYILLSTFLSGDLFHSLNKIPSSARLPLFSIMHMDHSSLI